MRGWVRMGGGGGRGSDKGRMERVGRVMGAVEGGWWVDGRKD